MPFQMSYSREELSGVPPVPDNWYMLQFKGFRPKASAPKDGKPSDSWNLNAEFSIIQNPEYEGRRVFAGLNSKAGFILIDFVHATGLEMEEAQDGNEGTEAAQLVMPGIWEGSEQFPEDPTKWRYQGPLINKIFEAELTTTEYQGRKRNEIRQYKCSVAGCAERHSTNLIKKG